MVEYAITQTFYIIVNIGSIHLLSVKKRKKPTIVGCSNCKSIYVPFNLYSCVLTGRGPVPF